MVAFLASSLASASLLLLLLVSASRRWHLLPCRNQKSPYDKMNNNNNVSKKRKKMHPITVDNENNGAVVTTADLVLPSENGNGYKAKKRQWTTEEYEKLWDGFSSSGGSTRRWKQISELQFNSNISAALIQRQWNSVSFHKWASSNKDAEPKAVLKAVRNAETDRERSLPSSSFVPKKRQWTTEEYEKLWDGFSSSGGSTRRWKQISELQFNSNISTALIQRQWNSVSFHKWASSNKDAEPKAVLKAVRKAETDRERSLPSSSSFVPIKQFCEYCTIELSTKKYTLPICVDTKACGKRQKMRKAENVDDDDDDDDDECHPDQTPSSEYINRPSSWMETPNVKVKAENVDDDDGDDDDDDDECHPDQTPSSEYINRPSSWMETPNVKVKAENVDDDDGDDDDDDDECHPDQTPSSEYINRPSSWMETPNVKVKEEDDDDDDGDDGGDSSEYINRPTNWAPSVTSMIKVEE